MADRDTRSRNYGACAATPQVGHPEDYWLIVWIVLAIVWIASEQTEQEYICFHVQGNGSAEFHFYDSFT